MPESTGLPYQREILAAGIPGIMGLRGFGSRDHGTEGILGSLPWEHPRMIPGYQGYRD